MAAYFGIHVGNSSVCLAISKDEGRADVVANDAGDRITPAVLQWTPETCIVGRTAQLELFRNSNNTIIRNKQVLNDKISDEELNDLRNYVSYKINKVDSNIKYELLYNGKQCHVNPREVAGWIFKKIYSIAESAVGGNKNINVVIAVPLYFSLSSIQLIKEVAKKTGFKVLQVVDEPSIAALGCGLCLEPDQLQYYCLVYRVGGFSIDATILLIKDGMFSVVKSVHKSHLGGALFTEKLSEFLSSEFKRQYPSSEISERGRHKLRVAAETVKQVLSIQNVAQCSCESIGGGYDLNCSVSRARFESLIAPLIPKITAPIIEVIDKSNLKIDEIKKVVPCGGSLKIPKLLEAVQKLLPGAEILTHSNPDEIIAIGTAMQAGFCSRFDDLPESLAIDIPTFSTSFNVTVKQENGEEVTHSIPENKLIPFKKRFDVSLSGKSVVVCLTDHNNTDLGNVCLSNLETSNKVAFILDINKEGKVLLTLINEDSGEKNYLKYDVNETKGT